MSRSNAIDQARRVLLPRNFDARDASDTHVWGVWQDELGVDHVLARRLVRPLVEVARQATNGTDAWTTQGDYRIDDFRTKGEGFDRFARIRVGASGTRVVTTDGVRSGGVRVWAPDGTLLLSMEHELRGFTLGVRTDAQRLWVTDRATGRTTGYGYDEADATDTLRALAGFEHFTRTSQGGFFGMGSRPDWQEFALDPSSRRQAVVHVTEAKDGLQVDTIALIDLGHANLYVALGDPASFPPDYTVVSITQPFVDHDLTWYDVESGSVGVVRRSGSPGEVEVFRIAATGDTTLHRRLSLPAIPVSDEDARQAIEGNLDRFLDAVEDNGHHLDTAEVRDVAETAVHVPTHYPAVTGIVPTAAGELWLKTAEVEGEVSVWYSLRLDERDSQTRRVLIPSNFRLTDAFEDHVWGLWKQSDDSWIVQGLRLLPPLAGQVRPP